MSTQLLRGTKFIFRKGHNDLYDAEIVGFASVEKGVRMWDVAYISKNGDSEPAQLAEQDLKEMVAKSEK